MSLKQVAIDYRNKCLQIVQKYIEIDNVFSEEEFLHDCALLTRAYFEDLIEERASNDSCGYVLCSNNLSTTSHQQFKQIQKYHIRNNKVYDISRRKNFCSDLCFNSTDFLRTQISTEPIYLRKKEETAKLILYKDSIGKKGDEVPLKEPLVTDNKEPSIKLKSKQTSIKNLVKNDKSIESKLSAPYLKEEEFKQIKQKFQHFDIQEKFDPILSDDKQVPKLFSETQNENEPEEDEFFYLDTITKQKILDDLETSSLSSISSKMSTNSNRGKLKKQKFFLDLMSRISKWITKQTTEFLHVDSEFCDNPPIDLCDEDPQKKLERYRWEYIRLCAKLNEEEMEDDKYDRMVLQKPRNDQTKQKKNKSVIKNKEERPNFDEDNLQQKLFMFFGGSSLTFENNPTETRKVRFSDQKDADNEKNEYSDAVAAADALFMPLNDNQHAHIRRKQLFLNEIQLFLQEILENQLENNNEIDIILDHIKTLVNTFNLNGDNAHLGKKQNYLTTIVLLRILILHDVIPSDKYESIFQSNDFIRTIMDKFNLQMNTLDDYIKNIIIKS